MRILLIILIATTASVPAAWADTVIIEADRDTTLIEHPSGALANGSGPSLFVGRTSQPQGSVRRALIRFDIAASLPRGAVVESASLRLHVSRANMGARELSVHRVESDWGEGASFSNGGVGAPATPGDATWIHRFFGTALWERPGGQFEGRSSASLVVSGTGEQVWTDERLAQDAQHWLRQPKRNFGWIVVGDESTGSTAVGMDSRENVMPGQRPRLEIEYRLPGQPRGGVPPSSRASG